MIVPFFNSFEYVNSSLENTKNKLKEVEEKIEIKPKEKITPVAEQAPQPVAKATEEIAKPQPEVIITTQTSEATTAQPVAEAPAKVATAPVVETPVQEVTEIREEDTSLPYNKSMSVEEICAIMTNEEAKNYIAPVGSCTGCRKTQTVAQMVCKRIYRRR